MPSWDTGTISKHNTILIDNMITETSGVLGKSWSNFLLNSGLEVDFNIFLNSSHDF